MVLGRSCVPSPLLGESQMSRRTWAWGVPGAVPLGSSGCLVVLGEHSAAGTVALPATADTSTNGDTNPLPWGKPWPKALAPPLQSQGFEMLRMLLALEGWECYQGVPQQSCSTRGHPGHSVTPHTSRWPHHTSQERTGTHSKDIPGFWGSPSAGSSAKPRTRG